MPPPVLSNNDSLHYLWTASKQNAELEFMVSIFWGRRGRYKFTSKISGSSL